jgi:hypothetical protein
MSHFDLHPQIISLHYWDFMINARWHWRWRWRWRCHSSSEFIQKIIAQTTFSGWSRTGAMPGGSNTKSG